LKSVRRPKRKRSPRSIRVAKTSYLDPNEKGGSIFTGEHIAKMWEAKPLA
jgi:hypothetical protein